MKHFGLFFALLLVIYAAGTVYVLYRGYVWSPCRGEVFKWISIVAGLFFILSFPLMNMIPLPWTGVQAVWMKLSYTWLVFVLFAFMLILLADISSAILHLFRVKLVLSPPVRSVLWLAGFFMIGAVLVTGNIRYRNFVRKEIAFDFPAPVKMLVVSDLHLGLLVNAKRLEKFVEAINRERPDVLLIAGDLVDRSISHVQEQGMGEILRKIETTHGIYAIAGNHEFYAGEEDTFAWMEDQGITVLRDSLVMIPGIAYLLGREDQSAPERKTLREIWEHSPYAGQPRELPLIVMDHQPTKTNEAVEFGVDLQLSGHTHAGQIWPVSWIVRKANDLFYGEYTKGKTRFYVTSGLAIWGPPFRVGVARSEYVVIQ